MTGRLIAFEGGEGSGKSTQAARLGKRLGALVTFEPGDTPLGAELRKLLLDSAGLHITDRAEALLMAADRAQHVVEVIVPALESGRTVVTDRFAGSSVAYQGHGRQLPAREVEDLSRWAADGVWPDLVVLLEVPLDVSSQRTGGARDRMEDAGAAFHARVHDGFLTQAIADPDRWVVVDGTRPEDEIAEQIWQIVQMKFPDIV